MKKLTIRNDIDKNLTSHIARYTFATTITFEKRFSLEIVSKMLVHCNVKTMQIYAEAREKAIENGIKSLIQKKKAKKSRNNRRIYHLTPPHREVLFIEFNKASKHYRSFIF
ncbi:site-specific integrase [Maribellus maritimus]|uniref:hypothetical protein n=1 Tax=Maribellus maritimus TaxID=2870838 RepID=UPI001EEC397C|nr:hypothetical protein [Maribellus maritimus]MCG6191247.1 hypothetical protein [Maribellus maritimus]